jgi:DNA-binding NarL/FixJ family response regulator
METLLYAPPTQSNSFLAAVANDSASTASGTESLPMHESIPPKRLEIVVYQDDSIPTLQLLSSLTTTYPNIVLRKCTERTLRGLLEQVAVSKYDNTIVLINADKITNNNALLRTLSLLKVIYPFAKLLVHSSSFKEAVYELLQREVIHGYFLSDEGKNEFTLLLEKINEEGHYASEKILWSFVQFQRNTVKPNFLYKHIFFQFD